MSIPSDFAGYPTPKEHVSHEYQPKPGANPVLKGLPLVVGASLVSRFQFLQTYLWKNGGFPTVKDLAVLDDIPSTFHPYVTPLGKTEPMIELGPNLLTAKQRKQDTHYYSASDYHAMYKSGKVTPLQVTQVLLELTSSASKTASIYQDAWADTYGADKIALEAAQASTERYAAGTPLGILDGVPIGVKDDISVKGYVNHEGMKYQKGIKFFNTREESLWPIQKLQEAGAVVIGKNRMQELGSDTNGLNIAQGTPTNHLNTKYYPGGSSSGAGSTIGAGLVPLCIGTDAGGSIRIPSAFNGVYGLKPSHHRTVVHPSTMCVVGPLAANASDLAIAYRIMSQPNPECSIQRQFALSIPPNPSTKRVIGIFRDWFNQADTRVVDICNKAIDYLVKDKGYEIVDITIPYVDEAQLAHSAVCIASMAEAARRRTPNPDDCLSLLSPVNKVVMSIGFQATAGDFLKYNSMRTLLMQHMAFLFQKYPGLLVLTPTSPLIGWARQPADDTHGMTDGNTTIRNMVFVFLANMAGTPAVSVPVGYVEAEQGDGKVPISLMASGEWGSEEQLLAWATETEDYLHDVYPEGRRRPVTWVDVINRAQTNSSSTPPQA